jgi:glucose-6-phosphate 1-dehydrogenase
MSQEEFHEHISPHVRRADGDADKKDGFISGLRYVQGQYDDREDLKKLNDYLCKEEMMHKDGRVVRLLYLSLPPSAFPACAEALGEVCKSPYGHTRIIVEKPFGRDLASFQELSAIVRKSFAPEEIYRIDHYVGKEIVQNLLVLRFCNLFLDPLWNRNHISSIEIVSNIHHLPTNPAHLTVWTVHHHSYYDLIEWNGA